jgi:hypothetical protein
MRSMRLFGVLCECEYVHNGDMSDMRYSISISYWVECFISKTRGTLRLIEP